jgi:hypothetical protein
MGTNDAAYQDTNWYRMVCKVAPGAQPTTSGPPNLPPVTIYAYDYLLRPLAVTENIPSGGVSDRVTTSTFENSGWSPRVSTVEVTRTLAIDDSDQLGQSKARSRPETSQGGVGNEIWGTSTRN